MVDAVACAAEIQREMRERNADVPEDRRIEFRIGVNLGDIIVEGDDIYGDGVNVAARLESIAKPGGVAVSAYGARPGRQPARPRLRGYGRAGAEEHRTAGARLLRRRSEQRPPQRPSGASQARLPLQKPSIAVLPFDNMSGDPEQEYFSDGITEDIITDLSKVSGLFVIAPQPVFTFKGKPMTTCSRSRRARREIRARGQRAQGRQARPHHRAADRRHDRRHLWAERYDRDLTDIFAVQDEITKAIVEALKVKLLPEEKKAIAGRGTTKNVEAYNLFLMARHYDYSGSVADSEGNLALRRTRSGHGPDFAEAWALIAISQWNLHELSGREENGLAAAERALALNPKLATAHAAKGRALAGLGRYDEAMACHAESLDFNPDSFDAHYLYGRTCTNWAMPNSPFATWKRRRHCSNRTTTPWH